MEMAGLHLWWGWLSWIALPCAALPGAAFSSAGASCGGGGALHAWRVLQLEGARAPSRRPLMALVCTVEALLVAIAQEAGGVPQGGRRGAALAQHEWGGYRRCRQAGGMRWSSLSAIMLTVHRGWAGRKAACCLLLSPAAGLQVYLGHGCVINLGW
jgi:hypothetical protein